MKTLTPAMKTPNPLTTRLERVLIAFFALAVLSLFVVYAVDPSVYTQTLMFPVSPADRYPVPATLFLICLLAGISLLIFGVTRHWRWVFWLTLLAFSGSVLQIPVTLLQIAGILPRDYPLWYSLMRLGIGIIEIGIAVWMIQIYRHEGVWAMGKQKPPRTQMPTP